MDTVKEWEKDSKIVLDGVSCKEAEGVRSCVRVGGSVTVRDEVELGVGGRVVLPDSVAERLAVDDNETESDGDCEKLNETLDIVSRILAVLEIFNDCVGKGMCDSVAVCSLVNVLLRGTWAVIDESSDGDAVGEGLRGGVMVLVEVGVIVGARVRLAETASEVDVDIELLAWMELEALNVVDNENDRLDGVNGVMVRDALGSSVNDSELDIESEVESSEENEDVGDSDLV